MRSHRSTALAALMLLSMAPLGCSEDAGSTAGGGGSEPTPDPVAYGPCQPLYRSECALLDVPLDHLSDSPETIQLHIARQPATQPAKRQLWLLSGGPGQAGYIFFDLVELLHQQMPETDIFVIDHRGTGYSHRLSCPEQDVPASAGGYLLDPADAQACLDHLGEGEGDYERLPYFTTRQAAEDVALAIARTRQPDQEVYVWGGSYGTHWAHRVLQVAGDSVSGFVFDGFMTPEVFSFTRYDQGVDEVGQLLSQYCAADPQCADKIGADPYSAAASFIEGMDASPCGVLNTEYTRLWASLFVDRHAFHSLVFPFLYRAQRCNAADGAAIDHMVNQVLGLFSGGAETPFVNSGVLQYNIALSELWHTPGSPPPSQQELEQAAAEQVFLVGSSYPASIAALRDSWPLPADDSADLALPVASGMPHLWLAGELDSRTPKTQSEAIVDLYAGPQQHFVMLAGGGHTPTLTSPLAVDPTQHCGLQMTQHFVQNQGALDDSCEAQLAPVQLSSPSEELAQFWWGAADPWGDGAANAAAAAAATGTAGTDTAGAGVDSRARIKRLREDVRTRLSPQLLLQLRRLRARHATQQ